MASIYAARTIGTGEGNDYIRAEGFDTYAHVTLMIDQTRSRNALVLSPVDGVTAPSLLTLLTAPTVADLKARLLAETPSSAERNTMDRYAGLNGANLAGLTAEQVTWWDCLVYLSRQINPVADLDQTFRSFA